MSRSSPLLELAELWNPRKSYLHRPIEWCEDVTKGYLWKSQREIFESIRDNRYTAVHAAHGLGKSALAARAIAWWIAVHPPGDAFVVSTAPSAAQVAAILWRELAKLHSDNDLIGKLTRAGYPQWWIGNELVGYGRKPSDYEESAFQGIHARYVLIVIDEACGVVRHLFDAVDALATNQHARVLAIGNPDDPGSHFASVCKPDSDWHVFHLDALRSPNFTKAAVIGHKSDGFGYANPRFPLTWALMRAEQIPFSTEQIPYELVDLLTGPLWVEERIRRWAGFTKDSHLAYAPDELETVVRRRCAASPLFQAKVRGVFPTEGTTGVIPLGWVQQAVNRWHDIFDGYDGRKTSLLAADPGRRVLGVDIAHGGEDETVFALRYGNIIEKLMKFQIADTMEVADNVAQYLHEPGSVAVVDVIGIGAGVYDALRRYRNESLIVGQPWPFNAAAQSQKVDLIGEFRFRNDRAAAWWHFRELLDPSRGSNIALPDDERLIEELVAVQYKHNVGGIIQIEAKDDIRKRLGRSTDSADAVIQAFWIDGKPANFESFEFAKRNTSAVVPYSGYNPFTDEDFGATPGIGGTGSDWMHRDLGLPGPEHSDWDL